MAPSPDCPLVLIAACAVVALISGANAEAQDRGTYVSGSLLSDVKRFSGDVDDNRLDGEAIGAALNVGTSVSERWDVVLGLALPASTEVVEERFITLRSSRVSLESLTRNRVTSMSALVRFRPPRTGRIQFGYLFGVSFVRLREEFETRAPDDVPATLVPRRVETVDYSAAPTVGIDVRIPVAGHLSLVPAVAAMAFEGREVGGVLVRPRVGVRWTF